MGTHLPANAVPFRCRCLPDLGPDRVVEVWDYKRGTRNYWLKYLVMDKPCRWLGSFEYLGFSQNPLDMNVKLTVRQAVKKQRVKSNSDTYSREVLQEAVKVSAAVSQPPAAPIESQARHKHKLDHR